MVKSEKGFSLIELAIAAAIASFLAVIAITIAPGVIAGIESKANTSASCSFNKEAAAVDLIEGREPDQFQTIDGEQVPAHECQNEKNTLNTLKNGGNANG